MIKELSKYIENNTPLILGLTLHAGKHPPKSNSASVTVEEPVPGIRDANPGLTDRGQTPIRILVCGSVGTGYFPVRDTAVGIFNLLHGKMQITLPTVDSGPSYLVNMVCNDPQYIGPDERKRDTFVVYLMLERAEN